MDDGTPLDDTAKRSLVERDVWRGSSENLEDYSSRLREMLVTERKVILELKSYPELHPPCPLCLQAGKVKRPSFMVSGAFVDAQCSLCKGRGTLLLSSDELTGILEMERAEANLSRYAACETCGYMGTNFRTLAYREGDFDAECPECGSVEVSEPQEALRTLVASFDTAEAERKVLDLALDAILPVLRNFGGEPDKRWWTHPEERDARIEEGRNRL